MAGARGNGSGVASAGILGAGWAALTNGFPIVYCPPVCAEARPLTDLGHVGSIAFGILLALVAIWSLWRAQARPGWFMPAVAGALVVGTLVSLASTPITEASLSSRRLATGVSSLVRPPAAANWDSGRTASVASLVTSYRDGGRRRLAGGIRPARRRRQRPGGRRGPAGARAPSHQVTAKTAIMIPTHVQKLPATGLRKG